MIRNLLLVLLAVAASTTATACGVFCTDSALEARPASGTPLALEAVLSSDGSPVSGGRVAFYTRATGPGGEEGRLIAQASTDSSGVARHVVQGGKQALHYEGATLDGYKVTFQNHEVNGVRYCSSSAEGSIA
ncbi:hypothetical protein [Lentzea nigeriaca]|uniref:hypothetical protein n=1 Tax=Lentzea nigeriaca TaxID=1128665 RepID=UPI00195AB43A|nr:hypothetical protein [Lentzea nigeriaca]MBM7859184.1 hypothetical protein [Lentzea nigeriaca]